MGVFLINPLTADDVYIRHNILFACSGCL